MMNLWNKKINIELTLKELDNLMDILKKAERLEIANRDDINNILNSIESSSKMIL